MSKEGVINRRVWLLLVLLCVLVLIFLENVTLSGDASPKLLKLLPVYALSGRATFSASKPFPPGNETNVLFQLTCSRVFWKPNLSYFVEAITARGATNYECLSTPGPSTTNNVLIMNVPIPPGTKEFRVKTAYVEGSMFLKARRNMLRRHPIAERWLDPVFELSNRLEGGSKWRWVWSPWMVKTNGGWVEQPER